jgi:polar amino acid transport system permease protein
MSRDFDWPELLFCSARCAGPSSVVDRLRRRQHRRAGPRGGAHVVVHALLRWSAGYIGLIQGTPLLMQLFLAYYGLAVLTGLRLDPWPAVTLAFTLYAAAFLGRDLARRHRVDTPPAVGSGGRASARPGGAAALRDPAAGVSASRSRPRSAFLVQLIKGTSIASIIGFVELTPRAGQLIVNVTFQPMIVYPVVAALYFILCYPISLAALRLERRIDAALGIAQRR